MPRSTETPEARILAYFRTAPLDAAQLLFGLVQGEMRARAPKSAGKPKVKKAKAPTPISTPAPSLPNASESVAS